MIQMITLLDMHLLEVVILFLGRELHDTPIPGTVNQTQVLPLSRLLPSHKNPESKRVVLITTIYFVQGMQCWKACLWQSGHEFIGYRIYCCRGT